MKKLFLITGESSGDMHAASLLNELYKLVPAKDLIVEVIGGNYLENIGAKIFFDSKYLASMGVTEVLSKLSLYLNLEKELLFKLIVFKPDVLILVDFPGFNLRIAKKIKNILPQIKIVYYLPPQVWAWNQSRTKILAKYCDLVLCSLPFEEEFHKARNVNAYYVGHPLIKELENYDRDKVRNEVGISKNETLIGIFPGSRNSEIHNMLPVFQEASKLILKDFPNVKFIVSQNHNINLKTNLKVLDARNNNNHKLLCASDILWLTSGTVTLEAALYETPLMLGYKSNPINYLIYLLVRRINMIGLPNIIMGSRIVPELIQREANSQNFYKITKEWLQDKSKLNEIKNNLKKVREKLSEKDASKEAANLIRTKLMPEYRVCVKS